MQRIAEHMIPKARAQIGLFDRPEAIAVASMIREPASHDDRVMTRSDRIPALIQERIGAARWLRRIQAYGCSEIAGVFS